MIILSNCLTPNPDEGALNVASSLVQRIKQARPETTVVTYERQTPESDRHLPMNKLLLNMEWIRMVRQKKEPVLYVPFPTRMLPAAVRIFILSWFARWGLNALLVMHESISPLAKLLIKLSGARITTVSRTTWETYREIIGRRAVYLKTGVDTQRFQPVDAAQKAALRASYGIPADKPVVLHVGHLKRGRNVGRLLELGDNWHCILVVSTQTAEETDLQLREEFLEKSNVTLLEDYRPTIQELYQLADVYLFPVTQAGNCIDVPLSALEAASCGIPVVATAYGELKELLDKPGFYPISSLEPAALAALLEQAVAEGVSPRQSVLDYDWKLAVTNLLL